MSRNDIDALDIIREGLRQYGGRQKSAGEFHLVQCAFHSDNTPSMGVYMQRGGRLPLGWFGCLGCGKRGMWNEFADKAKLQHIKEWDTKEKEAAATVSPEVEESLLGQTGVTLKRLLSLMNAPEAQPWPDNINWRGFKGDLISAVGGLIVSDYRADSIAALFPVKIGGKIRGGVKAVYTKREGETGYITMKGDWVDKYGLFPFDYTKRVIQRGKLNFVILVEGPRDALRLLKHGIPALAILGANTISRTKAIFVESLGLDIIYVMPDNDQGGSKMWSNVQAIIKHTELKRLRLPRDRDENGKIIKMDPFNAPAEIIDNLRDLLRKKNGWKSVKLYLEKK